MSVPGIVQSTLGGEEIAARVSLGGDDELFITSSRTLVYRSEGLLSDESVEEFGHEADRLTLSEGRRKTKFALEYPLEGVKKFSVPAGKTDAVLHPVLAGLLNGNEITEPGETVVQTYRFSELTLIITSERLVKHIGEAVWDQDYQEYHFSDVSELEFEDGSVATQIVLTVDGRPQRIKAPNDQATELTERLKRALFEYHDVSSLEELNESAAEEESWSDDERGASMDFGDSVDPLDSGTSVRDDTVETPDADGVPVHTAGDTPGTDDVPIDSAEPARGDEAAEASTASHSEPADRGGSANRSQERDRSRTETEAQQQSQTRAERTDDTSSIDDEFEPATVETADVFDTDDGETESRSEPRSTAATNEATTDQQLLERIERLEEAVDRQSDVIDQQRQTIEQLIAELRQGR